MKSGSNLPVLKILLFTSCADVLIGVCLNDVLGFISTALGAHVNDCSISFTIIIVIIIIRSAH